MQQVRRGYAALTNGEDHAEEDSENAERHRSQGRIEAPYRDEDAVSYPGADGADTSQRGHEQARDGTQRRESNMILQPSSMQGQGSEWRD